MSPHTIKVYGGHRGRAWDAPFPCDHRWPRSGALHVLKNKAPMRYFVVRAIYCKSHFQWCRTFDFMVSPGSRFSFQGSLHGSECVLFSRKLWEGEDRSHALHALAMRLLTTRLRIDAALCEFHWPIAALFCAIRSSKTFPILSPSSFNDSKPCPRRGGGVKTVDSVFLCCDGLLGARSGLYII